MKSSRYGMFYLSYTKSVLVNPAPAFFAANGGYEPVFRETNGSVYFNYTFGTL